MLKTDERDIDGLHVTSTQLPPMRSIALMTRMGRVVLPALAKLDGFSLATLRQADLGSLGPMISDLFARLSDEDAARMIREILVATSVRTPDGKNVELINDGAIDKAFAGRLPALLAAIKFALEVNYSGFFAGNSGSQTSSPESPNPTSKD